MCPLCDALRNRASITRKTNMKTKDRQQTNQGKMHLAKVKW